MKPLGGLIALGVVAWGAHAQTTFQDGFRITKNQTVTNAPAGYVGRKTLDSESRVGDTDATRGDSTTIALNVGGFVRACPTAAGVAAGSFEYSITRDEVDSTPAGNQTKHYGNRILARLEGHVKDDGMLDYIQIDAEVTRERDGAPPEQRTVSTRFRPGDVGQPDMEAMRDAVLSTADLSIAIAMSMGGTIYADAQRNWNTLNTCVEFRFDPPTKTRTLGPNESVDVQAQLVTKEERAPVGGGHFDGEPIEGIGRLNPRGEGTMPPAAPLAFTYTASAAPKAGHGFGVAAKSRAGFGDGKWEIRPAVRFEGTFSQSQNNSIGPADIAGAPLPPGAPAGLGPSLARGAAQYGIGATTLTEISGRLVWKPDDRSARAKTFGDVDSTFYVPSTDDGEITVDMKSVGQSMVGSCTIKGTKTFQVRELPPAARQFLVLEVAADGRYKIMLGMISSFLEFEATQTCNVRRRAIVEPQTVDAAAIVIGQQPGAMTPDGKIEGETPQPIVFGVLSYTGRWSFKRIEPQP